MDNIDIVSKFDAILTRLDQLEQHLEDVVRDNRNEVEGFIEDEIAELKNEIREIR